MLLQLPPAFFQQLYLYRNAGSCSSAIISFTRALYLHGRQSPYNVTYSLYSKGRRFREISRPNKN
ncbi:hypothetical protein XELAEV_18001268mg [Xenopus laevis]|uniref:Uncharacterized protein n=1 Tax=Xenopus laevis TaxID=8355 RepID=A0A974BQD4_XENLA|nr:hypothetical protein XELAEV_18001268mg [Xenopus laevis]